MISPASASHNQIFKLAAYERAGVREGETPVGVQAGVTMRWEPVVARFLAP